MNYLPSLGIRFNERDFGHYASNPMGRDREGYLQKRGEGNTAFKQRYFVLKGNFLFYFKGPKDTIPLGFILLENCHVVIDPDIPFAFSIEYDTFVSRNYLMAAKDNEDMQAWIQGIENAPIGKLRETVARLEKELAGFKRSSTGTAQPPAPPPSRTSGSFTQGSALPALPPRLPPRSTPPPPAAAAASVLPAELKSVTPPPLPADLSGDFNSFEDLVITSDAPPVPQNRRSRSSEPLARGSLELAFSCSILSPTDTTSVWTEASFFITSHRRDVKAGSEKGPWTKLGQTEVLEPVSDPQKSSLDLEFMVSTVIPMDEDSSEYVFELSQMEDVDNEGGRKPLGGVICTFEDIVLCLGNKLAINLRPRAQSDSAPQGWITIFPLEAITFRSPKVVVPFDVCPLTMVKFDSIEKHFRFVGSLGTPVRFEEVLSEPPLLFVTAIQFLELLTKEEKAVTRDYEEFEFDDPAAENVRKQQVSFHLNLLTTYQESLSYLTAYTGRGFRASVMKKEEEVQFLPINCHIHELVVDQGQGQPVAVYDTCTFGAPAAHGQGFKKGGALSLGHEEGEGKQEAPKGVLSALFGKKRGSVALTSTQGPPASSISTVPAAKNARTQLFSSFDQLCEGLETLEAVCLSPDMDPTSAGRLVGDVARWVEGILAASRNLTTHETTEADKLCETITHSTLPTFLAVAKSAAAGSNLNKEGLQASIKALQTKTHKLVYLIADAMRIKIVLEDAAIFSSVSLAARKDLVFSQCLGALVAIFASNLNRRFRDELFLKQLASIGYLAQFESLLSTSGDENGMIEDMYAAVRDLEVVSLRLAKSQNAANEPLLITGSRARLTVSFQLAEEQFALLPRQLQEGKLIPVISCVFSQGINEAQTMANNFGDTGLQENINTFGLETLQKYFANFKAFHQGLGSGAWASADSQIKIVDEVLLRLRSAIDTSKKERKKNPSVLILAEEVARRMSGGRLTSCKSAKDRTAMSMTLEETFLLVQNHQLRQTAVQKTLDALRREGVRRDNVEKNTGSRKYAFNYLQVITLPTFYKPPKGTYGGSQG